MGKKEHTVPLVKEEGVREQGLVRDSQNATRSGSTGGADPKERRPSASIAREPS